MKDPLPPATRELATGPCRGPAGPGTGPVQAFLAL